MTSALVLAANPASVPVQNPHRGAFLAERAALAVQHLAEARRLCEVLEGVLTSGAPLDQHRFGVTAKLAAEHIRCAASNALLKMDEIEGTA